LGSKITYKMKNSEDQNEEVNERIREQFRVWLKMKYPQYKEMENNNFSFGQEGLMVKLIIYNILLEDSIINEMQEVFDKICIDNYH
jgi:hypothetical protein